jgi:hypothetical protein
LSLYRLPALPILQVNSINFTILPANLKPGKSSTLVESSYVRHKIFKIPNVDTPGRKGLVPKAVRGLEGPRRPSLTSGLMDFLGSGKVYPKHPSYPMESGMTEILVRLFKPGAFNLWYSFL